MIDSSADLKENPQEQLLKEIINTLRNVSEPFIQQPFQPDSSSLNVNGLWFSSLVLTLISALGGVLAKGWLAKYNPASLRERSSDACERHLRALRAVQWRLEPIITGIPLLIQVSLLLFFTGLIIQLLENDLRIWGTVVALIGSAAFFYLACTCLPWFSPACPFQTPVSNFLVGGTEQGRYRDDTVPCVEPKKRLDSWAKILSSTLEVITEFLDAISRTPKVVKAFLEEAHRKPEQLEVQAQILSWVITNSTRETTIEEAIRAVGGSKPTKELQAELSRGGAHEYLRQRLQDCVRLTPGLPMIVDGTPRLESLLYALLRVEQPLFINEQGAHTSTFNSLVKSGQPLHRWDNFEPYLQGLAFSLRVHILVNHDEDDHDTNWAQTTENLERMVETGAPQYIQSILFLATIRGLIRGKTVLRRTCVLVLSKQVFTGENDGQASTSY